MQTRPRLSPLFLILLPLLAIGVAAPSPAEAVCTISACDAAALSTCCTASTCTLDGTVTTSAPTCTFDFGTRNLVVSGKIAAPGRTVTIKAKSVKLTGLIDLHDPAGGNAGNVTIVTTGMTALAFSQEGGTSAVINGSSGNGLGGHVTIQADGMVSFAKGSVTVDGGGSSSGGVVDVETSAGDIIVQIPISASSGATAPAPNGILTLTTPGNLTVGGSGALVADFGTIDLDASTGAATFADGSVVQANGGGGDIELVAGSVTAFGEFRAAGEDGSVDLHAVSGPMLLSRLSQGITVGPGFQNMSLETDASGANGLLTMDMPILANGAEVDIEAGGSLVVSKKIETTGILDSGAGDITLDAVDDVHVTKAIVGADVFGEADLEIDGRDITIEGNLDLRGGLDTPGGAISITADRDLVIQGDVFLNVSGADSSDAGSMDFQAGGDVTVASSVELIGDGSPIGQGAAISILAGENAGEHLPGSISFQGDIKANGHVTNAGATGSLVFMQGCAVSIPSGAVIDVTGDTGSLTQIIARTSQGTGLSIGGQLKATKANVLEFPDGAMLSLTGSFVPARSAGTCVNGTITANGCQRSVCTGTNTPVGCLYACPSCGDNVTQFPETCDTGAGGPFCAGINLCDAHCRQRSCASTNPCATGACDAQTATCTVTLKTNGVACDGDANVCTGTGTCDAGICHITPGTALQCDDNNPCTGNPAASGIDTCDPVTGCVHMPLDGPQTNCNDFCNGNEMCVSGQCVSGPPPCPAGKICDTNTQQCIDAPGCQNAGECADDKNPCTTTVCTAGHCMYPPVQAGTNCDDGDLCNGVRTCDANGICQQPTGTVTCNDNDLCTTDACNPQTGQCEFTLTAAAQACNAGNGTVCDGLEHCNAATGNCDPGTPLSCTDADPCTTNSCDPQNGCVTPVTIPNCQPCANASTCSDDADPCTDKACVDGHCQQVSNPNCCNDNVDCLDIDNNPCTDSEPCNTNTHRCANPAPLTGPACGTTCSPATCQAGKCEPDAPMNCNDNDPCTTDLCTDNQGCVHTPIAGCCFGSGACNDQNVCTTDTCDLDRNGCDHVKPDPTCTPCSGTDPFECGPRCTTACQAGRCVDVAPDCNDNNPCTTDACDQSVGCTNTPLDKSGVSGCDDGQACNGAEKCVAGTCQKQPSPECDDNDLCTDDRCDDATGCGHDPKAGTASVACRVDGITSALSAAATDAVNAKFRKKFTGKLAAIQKKFDKATAAGVKCKKAKNLLGSVSKQFRALQKMLNKAAGRQIDPTLATDLAGLAGQAADQADQLRNALSC